MECHACGARVVEGQKFCQECGQSLHGVTEITRQLDPREVAPAAAAAAEADELASDATRDPSVDATSAAVDATSAAAAAGAGGSAAGDPSGESAAAAGVAGEDSSGKSAGDRTDGRNGHDQAAAAPASEHWSAEDTAHPADGTTGSNDAASASPEVEAFATSDSPAESASPEPGTASMGVEPTAEEATLPLLADLPTQEIEPRQPLPDPEWAQADADAAAAASPELFDDLTTPTPAHPMAAVDGDAQLDATLAELGATPPPSVTSAEAIATEDFVVDEQDTDEVAVVSDATTVLPVTDVHTTDEFPAVFDGSGDVHHFPPSREPFKLRLTFVLAFFGAVATLMSSAADVTDIRTSTPIDGINIGITTLSDIGVNLPIAGFTGGVVMALGGLLACYGFRWGAGLAGGGGLAVAGWAALVIGLAEVPIAVAESITRTTTTQQFTLTVTRDLGFWLIVAAGGIGLLVFAASLRLSGTGGHRSLNPWVAAVGAVSALILAAGPLIPEGSASFSDNFRSPNALIDLPTAYFGGRLGQVALIAVAGVVGFLLVRAYGLGLAAGGISVGVWLWVSSLLGIGEDIQTRVEPLGIAAGNFGSGDTTPHGVTTVGMVLTLLMLLIAAVLATVQHRRASRRY